MEIEKNISLRDKNWFQTGGPAEYYCQPTTEKDFIQAVTHAREHHLALTLLGEGANVLISDEGIRGLVIRPQLQGITHTNKTQVTVEAGVSMSTCIDWCLEHNLRGLEEFSGIPGTIGGAAYINMHYFHFSFDQFLAQAKVINTHTGEIKTVPNEWFHFGYDQSTLQKKAWYLVNATLSLTHATDLEAAYAKGRRDEIIRQRAARYPTSHTCGSFFRNFHHDELTHAIHTKRLPFIAYYLDKLGMKGELSHGDAIVSHQHANMIVNRGTANSSDIITLARKMQECVFDAFGLIPQPECQFLGFSKYPLYENRYAKASPHLSVKPNDIRYA